MKTRFTCWSRRFSCAPARPAFPGCEPELAELLGGRPAQGQRVKVVGGGQSMSDIALTDGVLVSLDRMRSVVSVDAANRRVTVQGGIRLHELVAALASRGLALSILGSIVEQSIAGAISTGTHGSSLQHRNLPAPTVRAPPGERAGSRARARRLGRAAGGGARRPRRPRRDQRGDAAVRAAVPARRGGAGG